MTHFNGSWGRLQTIFHGDVVFWAHDPWAPDLVRSFKDGAAALDAWLLVDSIGAGKSAKSRIRPGSVWRELGPAPPEAALDFSVALLGYRRRSPLLVPVFREFRRYTILEAHDVLEFYVRRGGGRLGASGLIGALSGLRRDERLDAYHAAGLDREWESRGVAPSWLKPVTAALLGDREASELERSYESRLPQHERDRLRRLRRTADDERIRQRLSGTRVQFMRDSQGRVLYFYSGSKGSWLSHEDVARAVANARRSGR